MNKTLEDYVREVDYVKLEETYLPSEFALEFISFIKLVNNGLGEENISPTFHLEILDTLVNSNKPVLVISFRGSAKSSIMEYLILYIGTFGKLPNFGEVKVGMYVSDTMENGVKSMRNNLKFRFENSDFLKSLLNEKETKFNQDEWEFVNKNGNKVCFKGFGAASGVRGFKRYGLRPQIAIFDDLLSDEAANSDTLIEKIKDSIYKAVKFALDIRKHKIIWIGTPFNKRDPLYQAASSGGWEVKTYPVCKKFPCTLEEFQGAWTDRFDYESVLRDYEFLKANGNISSFNGELMLRIMSDDDRLIFDEQINWYDNRNEILNNKEKYSWYITTDFATSEKKKSDYSVISVWALSNENKWYYVDGILKRQQFTKTLEDLFRLAEEYKPIKYVGVEVSGQQQGFISIIKERMLENKIFFSLASDKKTGELGIRPTSSKLDRFNIVVPLFHNNRILFPSELQHTPMMIEMLEEIRNVTFGGFKSVHDDFADTISQLQFLVPIIPSKSDSEVVKETTRYDSIYNLFKVNKYSKTSYDSYLA